MAQVNWRMTTEYPQNNISGIGLTSFADRVAARTKGFVSVTNAFDNELKISSGEMPRAALDGRIAGGDALAGALSGLDPVLGLSTLPFLVQSAEMARIANARARPLYEKALAARGLKLLYLTIWPATGLWSEGSLAGADDLPKLNVRGYDSNSTEVMRAAGANAQFLPMDMAITALREHRLNAFLTSGDGGAGRKLWDFLPYFTAINYAMPVSIAFIRSGGIRRAVRADAGRGAGRRSRNRAEPVRAAGSSHLRELCADARQRRPHRRARAGVAHRSASNGRNGRDHDLESPGRCGCGRDRRMGGTAIRFRLLPASVLRRDRHFCGDCAVQGIDQRLELDEFVPRPLGLVMIEGSGQNFRMGVSVLDHAIAGFLQYFKSLVHLCSSAIICSTPTRDGELVRCRSRCRP
ncbi:hypothetical protein AB8Z38_03965 [Bradyrhizobium sp. LLZ17]|uniref:C4-dicarboxylate ABC transporter substrate-binding protein n=1 Tax=Bradyrhizobium sp. LLZ17 TaxID=3239388 RepID=A0AB39XMN0_9BRAD